MSSKQTTFDPKAPVADGPEGIPSFEGLIALMWFERKKAKSSGNDYARCKYEVIDGAKPGATFYANQSLDLGVAAGRLSVWCAAVGQTEAFDIGSDKEVAGAFLRKPFKAQVERKQNGQYINHDIKRMTTADKLTPAERKVMEGWLLDKEQERSMAGAELDAMQDGLGGEDDIPF